MTQAVAQDAGAKNFLPLRVVVVCAAALLVAGCAAREVQRVAVPVPCKVDMPQRPEMPTEQLAPDALLDDFVAAAAAEIERREGYEVLLRAQLAACAKE